MSKVFSCYISDRLHAVPTMSLLVAHDLVRARELAARELTAADGPSILEICAQDGRLLFLEIVGRGPRRDRPSSTAPSWWKPAAAR